MAASQTTLVTSAPTAGGRLTANFPVGVLALALVAVTSALSLYRLNPPSAVDADAPAAEFSSGRAMGHLRSIAREPHPLGTLNHEAVRDYIFAELKRAGLQPEIQQAVVVNPRRRNPFQAATVENVVARLEGSAGGPAVVLAGHYDSAPTSFGAGDDGSAVAAMLETLRALKAGPRLSRDVIFLFTDGEEEGLLGARAFVSEHRWMKDAGLVLNFEARGVRGPSIMFETSGGNGPLIREFARAARRPLANSLSHDVYKLLPNDTDFSVFKEAGLAGLNFAFIEGASRYHTALDNVQYMDERSLQHQGSHALSLARHFGGSDLGDVRGDEAVYFDVLGLKLISYSRVTAIVLAVLTVLLYLALVAYGLRRARLSVPGVALGFLAQLLSIFVSAVLTLLATQLVHALSGGGGRLLYSREYGGGLYTIGFVALSLTVTSVLYRWFGKKLGVENLAAGGLLWFVILLPVIAWLLPGGSYLFTWPLLFSLASLGWITLGRRSEPTKAGTAVLLALCAAPGIVLLVPMIFQLHVALGFGAGSVGVVILSVLLLALLIPHLHLMSGAGVRGRLLPAGAAVAAAGFISAAVLTGGFDERRPRLNELFYVLNADTGKAAWASSDARPDEWTSRYLTNDARKGGLAEYMPWAFQGFIHNPTAAAPLDAPEVKILSDGVTGGLRETRLLIASPRRAASLSIVVEGVVVNAEVNGRGIDGGAAAPADEPEGRWGLLYWAPPAGGIELTLRTRQVGSLNVRVVDKSYGLQALPGYGPRPAHLIPNRFSGSDAVFVSRSFSFTGPT